MGSKAQTRAIKESIVAGDFAQALELCQRALEVEDSFEANLCAPLSFENPGHECQCM